MEEPSSLEVKSKYNLWSQLDIDDLTIDLIFSQLGEINKKEEVYPSKDKVFKAFNTPYNDIKVVIIGQSPYHDGTADGLAFSSGIPLYCPPSLKVILKEVEDDIYGGFNVERIADYSLDSWASQGVLLLNTSLTVSKGKPEGHSFWSSFIDKVIDSLNRHPRNLVWMLWGNEAKSLRSKICSKHLVLSATHPMTEIYGSGGYYSTKHFSKCNTYLKENYGEEIIW